jgi:hypothetical protein
VSGASPDGEGRNSLAAGLSPDDRPRAFARLAPVLAFDLAVRPIVIAHLVKLGEALYRRCEDEPAHGALFLDALLAFAAPRRAERRFRRIAMVAEAFLADGRPPPGRY